MESIPCSSCGVKLKPYWLKNGICNGCRNPESIVTSIEGKTMGKIKTKDTITKIHIRVRK